MHEGSAEPHDAGALDIYTRDKRQERHYTFLPLWALVGNRLNDRIVLP